MGLFLRKHATDRLQQFLSGRRLSQIGDAAQLLGPLTQSRVVIGGDEDHGEAAAATRQALLEVNPGELGQLNIHYHAIEGGMFVVAEELLGGRVCDCLNAGCPQQAGQRPTATGIVVNHRNVGITFRGRVHRGHATGLRGS